MTSSKSLRSRTAWMVAGQASYIVSQFFILVALARLGTVENVGQFGFATAIITPIYWLTDIGLRTNKNTDAADTLTFANLFVLRLLTSCIGYVAILAVAAFASQDPTTRALLVIYGAAKGVETLSDIAYGVFERHGRMSLFAQSITCRGVGSLLLFTAILWRTGSVSAAFVSQLVVWTLVYLLLDMRRARQLSAHESREISWRMLWHTARDSRHLGMSRFLAAGSTAVPRFVIRSCRDRPRQFDRDLRRGTGRRGRGRLAGPAGLLPPGTACDAPRFLSEMHMQAGADQSRISRDPSGAAAGRWRDRACSAEERPS